MLIKKHLWLIFYVLTAISFIYLVSVNYSFWHGIEKKTNAELSSINNVFSASIDSTFTQQAVLLELLGQQLYRHDFYKNIEESTQLLDSLMASNKSFFGFGLARVDGKIILGSSNVKLDKMPNLRTSKNTHDTFLKALKSPHLSIGRTYYIKALDSYVIPIRKAIHDDMGDVLGVMTLGIDPNQLLLGLDELSTQSSSSNFTSLIVQDETFYRLFMASDDKSVGTKFIGEKVNKALFLRHQQDLLQQTGLTISDLRKSKKPKEYSSINTKGEDIQFSVVYLPKYKLWSFISKPRSLMMDELKHFTIDSLIVFVIVVLVLFVLFRSLSISAENSRNQLLKQANHDFLTGLHNRLYLKYIEQNWVADKGKKFSVLFIDLDNFKNINDHYGHNIGDKILKIVADRLQRVFGEKDLICRQGGDEFIILCPRTEKNYMIDKSKAVIHKITQPYQINQYEFVIGASMGIAQFPHDGDCFDTLFSAADTAMYDAKNKKHDVTFFSNELNIKSVHTSNIEQALHFALQKKELSMVYQPQIDLNDRIYGVEALVRWESDALGFVPPDKFISVAENSGLILEIGDFILHQSISDLARLSQQLKRDDIHLSINISVRQFLEKSFLKSVESLLAEYHFPASQLTLEITESIFIDDLEYILPLFHKIRTLGVHLSLDDFGTGFSSLSILKKLPIDELKIDKSFIDPIVDNEADRTMVVNILNIAKSLNLKVVAEGIEDAEQAEVLKQHRCDFQQGYYHSRPILYDDLLEYCKV